MTVPRHHTTAARRAGAAFVAALLAIVSFFPAGATERIVTERLTGLAIAGFDPVAYFTDGAAVSGNPAIEATHGGAVWRFRTAGNRGHFLARPEIYAPQFGGYDPVDLGRNVPRVGDPRLWLVIGRRLFLFAAAEHRDAFAADPERIARQAAAHWPGVRAQLAE